jgi:uncharacterized membrane protein YidH (DUF202 family)
MGNVKNDRTALALLVFGLAFVLFCLWLVFSSTQPGHRVEAVIDHLLPTWLVATNLILMPCLGALTAAASRIPVWLRFSFGALMFCSIVISEVSFRRFLLASCVVLAIILVEAYWIIPKWNAHHRRVR